MLKGKRIEYRIIECEHPTAYTLKKGERAKSVQAFYLQVLHKGLFKDEFRDYIDGDHPMTNHCKYLKSEEDADAYVTRNCQYNPTMTTIIKHPTIKIV